MNEARALGAMVQGRRHALGLSQRELGEQSGGVSQATISLLEQGRRQPSAVAIIRIMHTLNLTVAEAMGALSGEGPK